MSTSVTTTRTGLISDLGRTLLVVELQRHRRRVATRLSLCRDPVVCITATQSRPNNFQLQTNLRQDRREIHAWILADKLSFSFPGCSERFEDHAIQSAAVQEKASSIETRRRLVLMNHTKSFQSLPKVDRRTRIVHALEVSESSWARKL